MAETIVVGGGICGLQLASLLAADGDQVLVLEKGAELGGRAFVWEKDGFHVDNGIHLMRFGHKSATARVFGHIGQPIDFVPPGDSFVCLPDGEVAKFPTSPGGFLTTDLMRGEERLGSLLLLGRLRAGGLVDRLLSPLGFPTDSARGLPLGPLEALSVASMALGDWLREWPLPEALRAVDPEPWYATSVEDWMNHLDLAGGMRQYFHLVSASMQVCPFIDRASAGEMLANIRAVLHKGISVTYPGCGWHGILDALASVVRARGEVRTSAAVQRVILEGARARGVHLEGGETIYADRVVVSLPVQQLFEVLDESAVRPDFAETCKSLKPTAGIVLDYGLKNPVCEDRGLWYLWDPMSFGMFTSNLCPELAPDGRQLLTWLEPAEIEDVAFPERARNLIEVLEAALFDLFEGLEEAVLWRRARHLRMVDGVEVNVGQHRGRRPGYRVPGVDGLFLVGDSLKGPGAGGDVGHESVLGCYTEIMDREV